ncbi:MAG: hypothetical protein ACU0CO_06610 [Shimia sp.]
MMGGTVVKPSRYVAWFGGTFLVVLAVSLATGTASPLAFAVTLLLGPALVASVWEGRSIARGMPGTVPGWRDAVLLTAVAAFATLVLMAVAILGTGLIALGAVQIGAALLVYLVLWLLVNRAGLALGARL